MSINSSSNAHPWFVDFQDVWLAYNDELLQQNHFAVEAIDLKVRQGEFIAIVGPSGCGKSTFMKLTTGLKMPSMGKILIDGQPVKGPLKISGMAFQAPSLLPWRTTVDNVLLPLEIVEPYRSNRVPMLMGARQPDRPQREAGLLGLTSRQERKKVIKTNDPPMRARPVKSVQRRKDFCSALRRAF